MGFETLMDYVLCQRQKSAKLQVLNTPCHNPSRDCLTDDGHLPDVYGAVLYGLLVQLTNGLHRYDTQNVEPTPLSPAVGLSILAQHPNSQSRVL